MDASGAGAATATSAGTGPGAEAEVGAAVPEVLVADVVLSAVCANACNADDWGI